MRVITRTRLMVMAKPWPEARHAVCDWYDQASAAAWRTPNDLRATDPTAPILSNRRVVFNILGNRFRLM